ncbi:venom serine carboxypeptidase [Rhipicephalus sanguineus]|uniref:venom serine carboxypeptidase n=1 Tax=Rhipicephalus sanguineus TaxID=34632 RepID=UPI0020C2613A|nr:venom serine carboxypeptidase [Rhipicephalus sanguineus]
MATRESECDLFEIDRRRLDKPLFLTPFLETNDTENARSLSRVTLFEEEYGVEAHSGYITIDKTLGSHLFFLLTKTKHPSPDEAPLILWTFGGPGVSSLLGPLLFNGPFTLDEQGRLTASSPASGQLQSFAHVLYLDHPVGSGYSFAEQEDDDRTFPKNIDDAVDAIDDFLRQVELLFPEFRGRQFYFAGESYSARDAFGYANRYHGKGVKASLKLAGIMSGAGFIAPFLRAANPAKFLLQLGLIDVHGRRELDEKFRQIKESVDDEEILVALLLLREVFTESADGGPSLFESLTGYSHRASALRSTEPSEFAAYRKYVTSDDFKRAVHVGINATMDRQSKIVSTTLYSYDAFKDIRELVATVLDKERVLVYGGNMDVVYPADDVYGFLRSLQWKGEEDLRIAKRRPYKNASHAGGEVVGYKMIARNFTYALLVNSGHYVSLDSRRAVVGLYRDFVYSNVTST